MKVRMLPTVHYFRSIINMINMLGAVKCFKYLNTKSVLVELENFEMSL